MKEIYGHRVQRSPSRCTLAKATDQHHERVSSPLRGSLLAASAARFGPSALKVRSFWMDYVHVQRSSNSNSVYPDVDSEFEKEDSDETQLDLQNTSKNTEQEGTASGKEEDIEVSDLSVVSPREDKKRKQKKKSPERHSRRSRARKK